MLRLTDLILAPDRVPSRSTDWPLPEPIVSLLARVAPTNLPVLCTDCYGVAFRRIADALHACSGREEMVLVDLRRSGGILPAGLPNGARGTRTTLCLDGIEHLGSSGQEAFASQITRSHYRLITATDATLGELRSRWRPDLFALVSTVTVRAPTLARRATEIPALARERIALLCRELQRDVPELTTAAEAALVAHPWRGDTAELDAVLVRTLLAVDGPTIDADQLRWDPESVIGVGSGAATLAGARTERAPERPREPTAERPEAVAAPALEVQAPPSPEAADSTREAPAALREATTVPPPTVEAIAVELAHQLKNPLVTVKTFVSCVESLSEDPHELSQFRVLTEEAVTRMDQILDGLLGFARLGPPSPAPLDAVVLVRDALRATWRAFASKQVTLDAPEDATLRVVSDVEHLRFALGTLARHIAETIEARGTLHIEVDGGQALHFSYRESGAVTHLRGATSVSGLPLALLLARGALGRIGGEVEITVDDTAVLIRTRLAAP